VGPGGVRTLLFTPSLSRYIEGLQGYVVYLS
jgi:hypothetical protein